MLIKIDGNEINIYPTTFQVTLIDIVDGDSSVVTADGTRTRDIITTKRKIEVGFGLTSMYDTSTLLKAIKITPFSFYYPDPYEGEYIEKEMEVGDRVAPFAVEINGVINWRGLKFTLEEK